MICRQVSLVPYGASNKLIAIKTNHNCSHIAIATTAKLFFNLLVEVQKIDVLLYLKFGKNKTDHSH